MYIVLRHYGNYIGYITKDIAISVNKHDVHMFEDDNRAYEIYSHLLVNSEYCPELYKHYYQIPTQSEYIPSPGQFFSCADSDRIYMYVNLDEVDSPQSTDICAGVTNTGEIYYLDITDKFYFKGYFSDAIVSQV